MNTIYVVHSILYMNVIRSLQLFYLTCMYYLSNYPTKIKFNMFAFKELYKNGVLD